MRDGISFARRGIPAVALVTETFWPQGDFVSRSAGMPDIPRIKLPHPVAGSGFEAMTRIAESIADEILRALTVEAITVVVPANSGPSNSGPSNSGPSNSGLSNSALSNSGPSNSGPSNSGPSNGVVE